MKVLLINGSPRVDGCTYTALHEVADSLMQEGIDTEIVWIKREAIRGCIACGKCRKGGGKCAFGNDIVNEVIEKAKHADGFVVGSPVYFASANGALVALLDRAFYAGKQAFAYKPAAAVASARRAGTTSTIDELNKYFTISHMPIVSSRYWPMIHGSTPAEARRDMEGMQVMRILGRNMAWLLKCIQAGKQAGINIPTAETPIMTNFIR
mgnify:CR=1 FL=1